MFFIIARIVAELAAPLIQFGGAALQEGLSGNPQDGKPAEPPGFGHKPTRFGVTAWTGSKTLNATGVRLYYRTPDGGIQELGAKADPTDSNSYIKWGKEFSGASGQLDEGSAISVNNSVGLAGQPGQIRVFFQKPYQSAAKAHPLACWVFDWGKGWSEDTSFTTNSAYRGCAIASIVWVESGVSVWAVYWNDAGTVYEKTKRGSEAWSQPSVISSGGRQSDISASVWVKDGVVNKRVYTEKEAAPGEANANVKYTLHEVSWSSSNPTWVGTPLAGSTDPQNVSSFAFPDNSGAQRLFVTAPDGLTGELRKEDSKAEFKATVAWKGWKFAPDFASAAQVLGNKRWYMHFFIDSSGYLNMGANNSGKTDNFGYYQAYKITTPT